VVIARYSGLTQKAAGGTVTDDGSNTIHTFTSSGTFAVANATGGTITYDATDTAFIHTFTSSGTFTPYQALNVDYLVVAGGGGGGGGTAGGGGAGG
jgi:hypothetical protein